MASMASMTTGKRFHARESKTWNSARSMMKSGHSSTHLSAPLMEASPSQESDAIFLSRILSKFSNFTTHERQSLIIQLIKQCDPTEMLYLNKKIPQLHRDFIRLLPTDHVHRILGYIHPRDFCQVVQVSHQWSKAAMDVRLWQKLYAKLGLVAMANSYYLPHEPMLVNARRLYSLGNWAKGIFTFKKFRAHPLGILSIAFDSKHIITGSADRTCRVFDVKNGECIRILSGHAQKVFSVCLQEDRIFTGSSDQTICIWKNQNQGELLGILKGHKGTITCLKCIDNMLISGSEDKCIRIWDVSDENIMKTLEIQREKTEHSQGNSMVYHASQEQSDAAIEQRHPCIQRILHGHAGGVRSLDFNRNSLLFSGDIYGGIRLWHIDSGNCLCILHLLNDGLLSVQQPIVSSITMNPKRIKQDQPADPITCIQYINSRLTIGTLSGNLYYYKVDDPPKVEHSPQSFALYRNWVTKKSIFQLDNLYQLKSGFKLKDGEKPFNIWALSTYSDAWRLMAGGSEGRCVLWNHQSKKLLYILKGNSIDNGDGLLSVKTDTTFGQQHIGYDFNVETLASKESGGLEFDRAITGVAFDDRYIVAGGMDGFIRIWEAHVNM